MRTLHFRPLLVFPFLLVFLSPSLSPAAAPAGRYTVLTGGVVRDNKTGLNWQQTSSTTTYTIDLAVPYCSNNSPGLPGTGWRLPEVRELLTIVDDRATSPPTIDTSVFFATQAEFYLTNTIYQPAGGSNHWGVEFGSGGASFAMTNTTYVRCVR